MIIKNFIVFEGIDGSGTSTQMSLIAKRFPENKIFSTSEPTSKETGLFLRKILKGDFCVNEKTAAYLFAADRCEHVFGKNGIEEQAQKGKLVLSDRYFFSSLAYQTISCGKELPELLNKPFPLPELLFYFKISPESSMKRLASRSGQKEIYEKPDFLEKTSKLYDLIIKEYENTQKGKGMKVITVDAERSIEEISEFIWNYISELPIT